MYWYGVVQFVANWLCADEDPTHTWIHPKTTKVLLQLNPVGMGTDEQVDLGGDPAPSL